MKRNICLSAGAICLALLVACGGGAESSTEGGTTGAADTTGSTTTGEGGSTDGEATTGGGTIADGFNQFDCSTAAASTDRDGDELSDCDEINQYGTNPFEIDTDGDGFSDREEVLTFDPLNRTTQFNPRVADLPKIGIELVSVPNISLNYEDSVEGTKTIATGHSQSDSSGVSRNWGGETSRQVEIGHTVSVESTNSASATLEVSPLGLGGSATFETSLTAGLSRNRTQTVGSSVNWNNTQTQENTRSFNESEEFSRSESTRFTGGTISVAAKVVNDGLLAYDLESLTLSAYLFDPARPFDLTSIDNLTFSNGEFPKTSIITKSQSNVLNFSADLSLPQARNLLRNSRNLVVDPATFRLVNQDDRSALLSDQAVSARTATVSIDFGVHADPEQSFRVAVFDGSGNRSITALKALEEVLGLTIDEGLAQWVFGNEGAARNANEGLLSINDFSLSTATNSYWLGVLSSSDGSLGGGRTVRMLNLLEESYRLSDISLRAGDTLSFVYVTDSDRDALPDRYEIDFGTDLANADTDGDTVTDAREIFGVESTIDGPPCGTGAQVLVKSDPLKPDTDDDGIDDAQERADCTNPSFLVNADAGFDQIVGVGSPVTLTGQAIGLFDGLPEYTWKLVNGTNASPGDESLNMLVGKSVTFDAPAHVTSLLFDLEVSVNGSSSMDRVMVQVQQAPQQAVYVGYDMAGNLSANPDGTQLNPYPTIQRALSNIIAGDDLYVMTRKDGGATVPYEPINNINVPNGTDLFGAYDSNWVRDVVNNQTPVIFSATQDFEATLSYTDLAAETRLSGFSLLSRSADNNASHDLVALVVDGNAQATFIAEHNRFATDDLNAEPVAQAGSSYAAHIANLGRLEFHNNELVAGRAANGMNGGNGGSGESGARGGNASGINGGAGGDSGHRNDVIAGAGGRGASSGGKALRGGTGIAPSRGGARAGGGGAGGDTPVRGQNGGAGANGSYGRNSGLFDPTEIRYIKTNGAPGTRGQPGAGGGGGGGGAAVYAGLIRCADGGAGGGGGEGGTHGFGGGAGVNGGASVALWLYGIDKANVSGNQMQAAQGGFGGQGGRGGNGGSGGAGGTGATGKSGCFATGATGARGGAGGSGGRGSDGGGGSGGPSLGILIGSDVSADISVNSITLGNGGNGGAVGSTGNGGESVGIFDAYPNDANRPVLENNVIAVGRAGVASQNISEGGIRGVEGCAGETNCR